MAFPSSPINGQQATVNNTIYQYNTEKSAWVRVNPSLSSLTVTGNANVGNVISSGYYFANGTPFISGNNYGNTQVAAYLPTYTGNVKAGNVIAGGYYYSDGSLFTISSLTSTVNTFTGNGVQTDFALSVTPTSKNYTFAAVGGVLQPRSAYSVTGSTISFSSAPPASTTVEVTTVGGSVTNPAPEFPHPFMLMGA